MAERTGFEPVEERLAPHRFSKPAHSTTLPSLLNSNLNRVTKGQRQQEIYDLKSELMLTGIKKLGRKIQCNDSQNL